MLIRNARNITLLGDVHDHSVIQCAGGFGLSFMNVTNFTISNLNFQLCGAPILERQIMYVPNLLQVVNYIATLYLIQASGVKISNIQLHNSTGVGMVGVNAFASISQTTFTSNVFNCILIFYNNPKFPTNQYEKLIIKSSIFKHGLSPCSLEFASGLSMMFTQTTYTVAVTISNVTTYNNKRDCARGTGNIMFIVDKCSYHCTLVRAYSVNSTEAFGDGMSMEFRNIIRAIKHCNQSCFPKLVF